MFDAVNHVVARYGVHAQARQIRVSIVIPRSPLPLLPTPFVTLAVTVRSPLPSAVSTIPVR